MTSPSCDNHNGAKCLDDEYAFCCVMWMAYGKESRPPDMAPESSG